MDSSKDPEPKQQTSGDLLCDICDIQFNSPEEGRSHYSSSKHKQTTKLLANGILGYATFGPIITSLSQLYFHPNKRGTLIGLQYMKIELEVKGKSQRLHFSCILCGAMGTSLYQHLISLEHKIGYIAKDFSFLFEDVETLYPPIVKNIAMVIEKVEGLEKFKVAVKNFNGKHFPERSSTSDNLPRQTLDRIVELLKKHAITFKNPYGNEVPQLQTRSNASGTNKKKNINTSVPSEPSAITSRQVNDKISCNRQIHGNEFKAVFRKKNDAPCLQAGSRDGAINVNSGKRPLGFTPLTEFKQRKTELPSPHAGELVRSLSRPVPMPFFLSDPSVVVPICKHLHGHNSLQENKLRTTTYVPPMNEGIAPKPMPSLYSSHTERWASETTRPPAGEYSSSWPPAVSFYQNAKHKYGYSDQSLYEFANKPAYVQGSSVYDLRKANAFEGQTWRLETGHLGPQHSHTLGATGGSVKSLNGPSSSVSSLKHDTSSLCGRNSLDGKELFSKSSSPSAINSVLNQEPSLTKTLGANLPPERSLPTNSTNSHAQTSQSTNSRMPDNASSMLSPQTLKILQGREPESVKSILKRLSEYCPELQQVNISLLVDVLFEIGALS